MRLISWFYSSILRTGKHYSADLTDFLIGHVFSNTLFTLACVSAIFEYIWRPIDCFVPQQFTNAMEQYAESYCFGAPTYYLPLHMVSPSDYSERRWYGRMNFRPSIPIILLTHALLLRLPRFVWILFSKLSSVNLTSLVNTAEAYATLDSSGRQSAVKTAADYLHSRFALCDPQPDLSRTNKLLATLRDYWRRVKHPFPNGVLALAAVLTKLAYVLTTTVAFIKLCQYLPLTDNHTITSRFGWDHLNQLYAGASNYDQRDEAAIFPDVVLCDYEIRLLGNVHHHTVQCYLPLHRFYTILVILLWFAYYFAGGFCWLAFIHTLFTTLLPWPRKWFVVRALYRRRALPSQPAMDTSAANPRPPSTTAATAPFRPLIVTVISPTELRQFVESHLRTDGYFALKYVSDRDHDLFVHELINELWRQFAGSVNSLPSIYDRSVEASPAATRHKYHFVDQTATNNSTLAHPPPSVQMARKIMTTPATTSVPSIPPLTSAPSPYHHHQTRENGSAEGGDESKRPLLLSQQQALDEAGGGRNYEITKM